MFPVPTSSTIENTPIHLPVESVVPLPTRVGEVVVPFGSNSWTETEVLGGKLNALRPIVSPRWASVEFSVNVGVLESAIVTLMSKNSSNVSPPVFTFTASM